MRKIMEEYIMSDEDKKHMDEAMDSLHKYHQHCEVSNRRLIRAVASVMGQQFHDEVAELFEQNEVGGGFWYIEPHTIVRNCPEKDNECDVEDWEYIKDYRVEQWSVGMEGDSYHGYIYVKLNKDKWLKAFFSM